MRFELLEKIPGVKTEEALFNRMMDSHATTGERVKAGALLAGEALAVAAVVAGAVYLRKNPLTSLKVIASFEGEAGASETFLFGEGGTSVKNFRMPAGVTGGVLSSEGKLFGLKQDLTVALSPTKRVPSFAEVTIGSPRDKVLALCGQPIREIPYPEGTALIYEKGANNSAAIYLKDSAKVANWHDPDRLLPVASWPNGNHILDASRAIARRTS